MRILRVLPIGLLIFLATPAAAQRYFPGDEDLMAMLRYLVEDGATPGVVLGIVEADGQSRILSYGDAISPSSFVNSKQGFAPLGPRSIFEIGSVTKAFTGILLAEMAHKGEVSLDDPVSRYLPDSVTIPSRGGREITLLDLATHLSGLPFGPDNLDPADPADPWADYTVERLYAFLSAHELRREPGEAFEYSNVGAALLGHALARAIGTDLGTLLRERVLDPLGMHDTGFSGSAMPRERLVAGHGGSGEMVSYWSAAEAIRGAGGLLSTAEDLVVFLKANLGWLETDLLPVLRAAQEPRRRLSERTSVGLFWQVEERDGRTLHFTGGRTGGFRTAAGFDTRRRVGYVILTNSGALNPKHHIGQYLLRSGPPPRPAAIEVPADILRSYVGTYQAAPGEPILVRQEEDGNLTVQSFGDLRHRIVPESDSTFFAIGADWRLRFTRTPQGDDALALQVDGEERLAPKVAAIPTADLPLDPNEISRYEGTYEIKAGEAIQELRVYSYEGHLYAQFRGRFATQLRNLGGDVFAPEANPDLRYVFAIEDGRAPEIAALRNGATVWAGSRRP
jgi:CubicO group peptidase (beta-lactamase class C family)